MKAIRAIVQLGDVTLDGFMLPDGSYRMSQTLNGVLMAMVNSSPPPQSLHCVEQG